MSTYVILLIAVIVLGVPSLIILNKYPKTKAIFHVLFISVIVLLFFLLGRNIYKPISFDQELDKREKITIQRLKDIRTIQVIYKDKYTKYTKSLDSLISFYKIDSIEIEKYVQLKEWKQDEMSREQALKKGILKKISQFVPVKDSILKEITYNIEEIKFVPYTDSVLFKMGAGEVQTASNVKVKVFECYALYSDLLNGMDEQLFINFMDKRKKYYDFPGIKVGSLEEATNNAGNWE